LLESLGLKLNHKFEIQKCSYSILTTINMSYFN